MSRISYKQGVSNELTRNNSHRLNHLCHMDGCGVFIRTQIVALPNRTGLTIKIHRCARRSHSTVNSG